jgi:hypothetical protein
MLTVDPAVRGKASATAEKAPPMPAGRRIRARAHTARKISSLMIVSDVC